MFAVRTLRPLATSRKHLGAQGHVKKLVQNSDSISVNKSFDRSVFRSLLHTTLYFTFPAQSTRTLQLTKPFAKALTVH